MWWLPPIIRKKKKKGSRAFSTLKERIGKKMQGWKKQLLSLAWREVLLKAVELKPSQHMLWVFSLYQKWICEELNAMMSKVWWGNQGSEKKKNHWMSWTKLCKQKQVTGWSWFQRPPIQFSTIGYDGNFWLVKTPCYIGYWNQNTSLHPSRTHLECFLFYEKYYAS